MSAVAAVQAAEGDGWMTVTNETGSSITLNWDANTASWWKDGIYADGVNATAWLDCQNRDQVVIALGKVSDGGTGKIRLHALKMTGSRVRTEDGTHTEYLRRGWPLSCPDSAFVMCGTDPLIRFLPPYIANTPTVIDGNALVVGDGSPNNVLTIQGGGLRLITSVPNTFVITNFSRVVLKDHPLISSYQSQSCGVVAGDAKLMNVHFQTVWNSAAVSVDHKAFGGTLTIGAGLTDVEWSGTGRSFTLAGRIERERAALFRMNPHTDASLQCRMPNATELMGDKGRLPTWFLNRASTFDFLSHADGKLAVANSALPAQFDSSKDDETVVYDGALLHEGALNASAVSVKSKLDLSGRTLTLGLENGDEPGLLVMNADVAGSTGTLAFEGPEGIIAVGGNGSHRVLSPRLTGASSLTIVAGFKEWVNDITLDNAANDFSGGIDLLTGALIVKHADALGTGSVRIHGYPASYDFGTASKHVVCSGGTLCLDGCTITNGLRIAGMGGYNPSKDLNRDLTDGAVVVSGSALYLKTGSGVSGDIVLEKTAAIRSAKDSGETLLSGSISNASLSDDFADDCMLYLWPGANSVIKLANEISTGAIAITAPTNGAGERAIGTVALTETAALDTQSLRNDGVLKCEADQTLDFELSGEGAVLADEGVALTLALVKTGAGMQAFGGAAFTFDGSVRVKEGTLKVDADMTTTDGAESSLTIESGAVLDVAGRNLTVTTLENFGTIRNTSETPVVLTVRDATLVGAIEGAVTIRIDGGTAAIKNWRNMDELPVSDGVAFHLDASDLSTLLLNEQNQVTNWVDKSGNGNDFMEDSYVKDSEGVSRTSPLYVAATNGNRGAVVFNTTDHASKTNNRLSMVSKTCELKTVFIVTSTDESFAQLGADGYSILQYGGLFGRRGDGGNGLYLLGVYGQLNYGANGLFNGGTAYMRVNGNENKTGCLEGLLGVNYIFEAGRNDDGSSADYSWSLGQFTGFHFRGYKGTVSEVIGYDRYVTDEERALITDYLRKKWASETVEAGMTIGERVSLVFANGGTLDLGGTTQTINALSGAGGSIVNGSLSVGGILQVNVNGDGSVTPYRFNDVTLADGLRIKLNGTPADARIVIATGVKTAHVRNLVPPAGWKLNLNNDRLSLSRDGMMIIIR